MEQNGYPAVNSEKTIFMKRQGSNFIMHGLFVDYMMHVPTCDKLRDEFLALYQKDVEIPYGNIPRDRGRATRQSDKTTP